MELLPGGELFERIPIGIGLHVQQMFIYYAQVFEYVNILLFWITNILYIECILFMVDSRHDTVEFWTVQTVLSLKRWCVFSIFDSGEYI